MASLCRCGSGKNYIDCCERFLSGKELPLTPEELMRSRYTAYTLANINYIIETMQSPAADNFDADEAEQWAKQVKWLKLEVLDTSLTDSKGFVEFIAHYSFRNKKQFLHERSEFHRQNGRWYYVDGVISK